HELGAVLGAVALGLAVVALGLLAIRTLARRERRVVRRWLLPYRSDEANEEAVQTLLESWHQVLLERWWRRPLRGQPGTTLEIVTQDDGQGRLEARLLITVPAALSGA